MGKLISITFLIGEKTKQNTALLKVFLNTSVFHMTPCQRNICKVNISSITSLLKTPQMVLSSTPVSISYRPYFPLLPHSISANLCLNLQRSLCCLITLGFVLSVFSAQNVVFSPVLCLSDVYSSLISQLHFTLLGSCLTILLKVSQHLTHPKCLLVL